MHKGNISSRPSFRLTKYSPEPHRIRISTPWQEGLNLPLGDLSKDNFSQSVLCSFFMTNKLKAIFLLQHSVLVNIKQ